MKALLGGAVELKDTIIKISKGKAKRCKYFAGRLL